MGRDVKIWLGTGAVLLVSGLLYMKMFSFWAYRDELRHLSHSHQLSGLKDYIGLSHWIRPLELLVNFSNTRLVGYEVTHVSHFFSFSAFMLCVLLVFLIGRKYLPREWSSALFAAALFAFHPVNVASVYRIDTISQLLVTLVSLGYLYWLIGRPTLAGYKTLSISFLFTALLLLSKETSLGLVIGVPMAAFIIRSAKSDESFQWQSPEARAFAGLLLVALAVLIVYVIARHEYVIDVLGPTGSRYEVEFSAFNIVKNMALSFASLMYFGNTLELFVEQNVLLAFITAILSLAILSMAVVGLVSIVKRREWRVVAWSAALLILILSSLFPAVLIQKVNELYSFGPSPYFCMLVAFLGWEGFKLLRNRVRVASWLMPALLVVLIGWMGQAITVKLAYADEENRRARILYTAIAHGIKEGQPDGEICIKAFSPTHVRSYNMFISPDYELLQSVMGIVSSLESLPLSLLEDPASVECRYKITVEGNHPYK